MPVPENWMSSPLPFIDILFEKNGGLENSMVSKFFGERLENSELYEKIPSLNDVPLHLLSSGSLVRYRGMVQDTFDPEFFLSTFEVLRVKDGTSRMCTALYRDIISCAPGEEINFDSSKNVTADRQTIYCVPVPGENAWAKTAYASMCIKDESPCDRNPSGVKRSVDCVEDVANETNSMDTSNDQSESVKRNKPSTELPASTPHASNQSADLNFPLPFEKGPACLVKIYGNEFEDGKLNEVIEVIGILSLDPTLATFSAPTESHNGAEIPAFVGDLELMDSAEEHAAKNPPPSLVPRLHAVRVKRLTHTNPFLPSSISRGCVVSENFVTIRDETLAILEQALLGDRLAAEYMLCNLISSVYSRRDVMALGKFSLNLSGCPADQGSEFVGHVSNLVSSLVTKSHLLPLSLENLNAVRFTPRKDYTANRLRTGLLQLSDGTHLIVDETTMAPGQLDAQGVTNLTALSNVIMWQKLDYDFEYHTQSFFTDLIVLVMSEGKSLLKCDCQLPIVYNQTVLTSMVETYNGIHTYLTPNLLQQIRTYLSHVQLLAYSVPDDTQKVIENDFVQKRKECSDNLSVPDFHLLLTLARLLSLSCGETSLSEATWRQALVMETMRADRLKVTRQS